jgi:crotonobetainyl-CoA:carnitine CoA-transferase CaiB-like acyl-CoA transferase
MSGILSGLRVLDLTWGVAGPLATMILADHGADVTKIEPPGGDPFRHLGRSRLGYKTWQRGKRSAVLDLKDSEDLKMFKALASAADILVESYSPGVTERLGVDYATLSALNPRLIYATISAYRDTSHKDRPGYDLLVAARMGLHWEHRGWPEGSVHHTARLPDPFPDLEIPYEWRQGPPREGPMVIGVPTASLGAFYSAISAISAALVAREKTGLGQHVETSLMQGAAASALCGWQRSEHTDLPDFATWVMGSKSPKGHFECSDGRWIHNWVPNPRFILSAAAGDTLDATPDLSVHNDPNRVGTGIEEIFILDHYHPLMAEAVKKFPCDEWLAAGAVADIPLQEPRSPERSLSDPLLLADGCVRELDDPELGRIRQVGTVIEFAKTPAAPGGAAPSPGQHTEEIRQEAARLSVAATPPSAPSEPARKLAGPLDGVRVLDLGLAVAGPFGTQVLGDLGADVLKINAFHDAYWLRNHIAFTCNRSKRSVCIDLKDPRGREVLLDLVRTADVVQHNMRYEAAIRLGVDYESLKAVRPDLIYCHTRGHERGPREALPGNEQTGACLAGVEYEDGAMADGGKPIWALTTFGDTGCGFLSAIGIMHALYHRERTGEGQFLNTAIVNAQLLNCSHVLARPDGEGFDRWRLDRMHYGLSALYGLYETSRRWLAVAAVTETEWAGLKAALPAGALDDAAFATPELRQVNDRRLRATLEAIFRKDTAEAWRDRLDAAGAPCEISDETVSQRAQDDPEFNRLGMIAHFEHPVAGKVDQVGLASAFSDTPSAITKGPIVLGEGTGEVLAAIGYSPERLASLAADRVIGLWSPGQPMLEGPHRFIGGLPKGAAAEEDLPSLNAALAKEKA